MKQKPRGGRPGVDRPKPPKEQEKLELTGNKRLAEQNRRLLAKHYASKYRVR
jgi:hypothetical protein